MLESIHQIPIAEVAKALGIDVKHGKAMCFSGHDSKTPSFTLNKSKNTWKCYGCGEFGDSISLVEKVHDLNFLLACNWLCNQFGIDHHPRKLLAQPKPPAKKIPAALSRQKQTDDDFHADSDLYTWLVSRCGAVSNELGAKYLACHGISLDIAKSFGVVELNDSKRAYNALIKQFGSERLSKAGIAQSDHLLWSGYGLIFPFKDNETVQYFQVRCFAGDRKFIGPRGIQKPIYNALRLKTMKFGDTLHICEGIPDALALEGQGIAAVGVLGASSFRTEWVEDFLPFDLVGVPDGDAGGLTFKRSLKEVFQARSKPIRFLSLPVGMDASDVVARINNA